MPVILGCFRGAGDRESEPIEDSLISTENMAEARGKSFIDKNYYDVQGYQWTCPHKSNEIQQYKYTTVTGERIDLSSALMKITDYEIGWKNHQGMKAQIGLEYYKDSPFTACIWNDNFDGTDGDPVNSTIWNESEFSGTDLGILGNKAVVTGVDSFYNLYHKATIETVFEIEANFSLSVDLNNLLNSQKTGFTLWLYDYYIYFHVERKKNNSQITYEIYDNSDIEIFAETINISDNNFNYILGVKLSSNTIELKYNRLSILKETLTQTGYESYIEILIGGNTETGYESKISIDNFRFISGCPGA